MQSIKVTSEFVKRLAIEVASDYLDGTGPVIATRYEDADEDFKSRLDLMFQVYLDHPEETRQRRYELYREKRLKAKGATDIKLAGWDECPEYSKVASLIFESVIKVMYRMATVEE